MRVWALSLMAVVLSSAGTVRADVFNMPSGQKSLETVWVRDTGNPAGFTGYGAVSYAYQVGKYEVTNAQYCQFLNAKAKSDPYGLYNPFMATETRGGITRLGSSPGDSYSIKPGYADRPVTYVSWYDAVRFANWLTNGQGDGDTESGSYTITGGGPNTGEVTTPSLVERASWAVGNKAYYLLPSEDEWCKAAYFDPNKPGGYWNYPTHNDTPPTKATVGSNGTIANPGTNVANYKGNVALSTVGTAGDGSASFYGTFDQGGNVCEWNETMSGSKRVSRGGACTYGAEWLNARGRDAFLAEEEASVLGFRVARIPEPCTITLLGVGAVGLLSYGWWKRNPRATRQLDGDSNGLQD